MKKKVIARIHKDDAHYHNRKEFVGCRVIRDFTRVWAKEKSGPTGWHYGDVVLVEKEEKVMRTFHAVRFKDAA